MDKQEIFDFVISKLHEQGKQCVDELGNCRYRGPNGMKCAIGHLIPDDSYREYFESQSVTYLPIQKALSKNASHPVYCLDISDNDDNLGFLIDLQDFHDNDVNWDETGLRLWKVIKFADRWDLDTTKIAKLFGI